MRREAPRSLRSLSARYQQGLDGRHYEVIVVENGSDPDQRLGAALVEGFGSHFRYIDMGDDATPSPVPAMNRGLAKSKGRALALMIDGAHVLTPRVLHYGLAGLEAYGPAVVATQAWYVGPGQQGDVMRAGYDQAVEDALFEQIALAGGRLPALRDRPLRRRSRLVRRSVGEQLPLRAPHPDSSRSGGLDEAFAMPGGGYSNLDLYERLAVEPRGASGHHPRRGVVPPAARRHHHQPAGSPRAAATRPLLRQPLRGPPRSAVHGPGEADPLRGWLPQRLGQAVARPANDRQRLRCRPPPRRDRWPGAGDARPCGRRPARRVHHRIPPEPGLGRDAAGWATSCPTRRPTS